MEWGMEASGMPAPPASTGGTQDKNPKITEL